MSPEKLTVRQAARLWAKKPQAQATRPALTRLVMELVDQHEIMENAINEALRHLPGDRATSQEIMARGVLVRARDAIRAKS